MTHSSCSRVALCLFSGLEDKAKLPWPAQLGLHACVTKEEEEHLVIIDLGSILKKKRISSQRYLLTFGNQEVRSSWGPTTSDLICQKHQSGWFMVMPGGCTLIPGCWKPRLPQWWQSGDGFCFPSGLDSQVDEGSIITWKAPRSGVHAVAQLRLWVSLPSGASLWQLWEPCRAAKAERENAAGTVKSSTQDCLRGRQASHKGGTPKPKRVSAAISTVGHKINVLPSKT